MIEYYLQLNYLSPDNKDYIPRIRVRSTLYSKDIIRDARKIMPQVSEGEFISILDVYFTALLDRIKEGHGVSTDYFNIRPSFEGKVEDEKDSIDPNKVNLVISISASPKATAHIQGAQTKKVNKGEPKPFIIQYFDATSQTTNTTVSPSSVAQTFGEQQKFDPTNANEGSFFVNTETNEEVKVTVYLTITNSKVSFQVPALPPGTYWFEIRRYYGTTNKVLRIGRLNAKLTVA